MTSQDAPARPAVSVLMPVRDGAPHLDQALRSMVEQTLEDLEVIVVDDGSTDATPEILGRWSRRDSRVRHVRQEPSGIVTALERARKLARGTYLARMDADDVSVPERLERQRELMEARPALVACGTGVRYFPGERVRDGARRYERWVNGCVTHDEIVRAMFVECPVPHPTFFMRSEAVAAIGGYRDRGWPEDYDLLLRLWEAGGRLGKVPETLLEWRESDDRLSRTHTSYSADAFVACKAHFLMRTLARRRNGVVVWGAGPVGKAASRALSAAGARVRCFVEVDPRKIGQEIHGVPVLDTDSGLGIRDALHLAAVGQEGARERLERTLDEAGFSPPHDFVAIA